MKYINAHLLKGIIFIVIATLVSCSSFFNDAVDKVIYSFERSNKILIDSNIKIHAFIKKDEPGNTDKALTADSLMYANEEANALIGKFKEEINNLKLVGKGKEHADALFGSVFTFTPLVMVVSDVDARTSMVMRNSKSKLKLDSILVNVRSLASDSLWRKRNVEGVPLNGIVLELSYLQNSCSSATNLALNELR